MSRTVQLNMVKMYVLYFVTFQFSSVQSLIVSESLQPQGLQDSRLPCPSPTPGALKLMSIGSVMPSNHLILCYPLLLLPSIFPSIRVFSNESALHIRWRRFLKKTKIRPPFDPAIPLLGIYPEKP